MDNQLAKHCNRNEQKKIKRERHEREKDYMGALQGLGCVIGEYVGDGIGNRQSGTGSSW